MADPLTLGLTIGSTVLGIGSSLFGGKSKADAAKAQERAMRKAHKRAG